MSFRIVFLVVFLSLFSSLTAMAATVTVTLSGIVNNIENIGSDLPFSLGDRLTTTLSYDENQTIYYVETSADVGRPTYPFGFAQYYSAGVYNDTTGQFFADASQFAGDLLISTEDHRGDYFSFSSAIETGLGKEANFYVGGLDSSGTAIKNSDLPEITRILVGGDFSEFDFFEMAIIGDGQQRNACSSFCSVTADIDTVSVQGITAVPIPSALPLMALGLVGLGFLGRRRLH